MHTAESPVELFLMRQPNYGGGPLTNSQITTLRNWGLLREAIERCGAQVLADRADEIHYKDQRSAMYVRDAGIVLDVGEGARFYCSREPGSATRLEKRHVAKWLKEKNLAMPVHMHGSMDGGDTVYDPSRRMLFVGVKNYDYQRDASDGYLDTIIAADKSSRTTASKAYIHRFRCAQPTRHWLKDAAFQYHDDTAKPIRVVRLFVPDHWALEAYHLDGIFNVLPSGQAVWCPEMLSHAARQLIEKHIPAADRYPIGRDDARHCATNFITVRNHVITPYAPPALKETFTQWGYRVVDPQALGLAPGSWHFGPGASVRCATLKVTPDYGCPPQARSGSLATQAVR